MKTGDKYRYTIQFKADTEANIRVGDTLEAMGNRKGAFIVAAVTEYLEAHPEQQISAAAERAVMLTRNDVKKLILNILNEMDLRSGSNFSKEGTHISVPMNSTQNGLSEIPSHHTDADVDDMLNNLSLFL